MVILPPISLRANLSNSGAIGNYERTLCVFLSTLTENIVDTFYVQQIENTCSAENAQQWFYILHKQCNALNAHQEEANSLSCARVDVF